MSPSSLSASHDLCVTSPSSGPALWASMHEEFSQCLFLVEPGKEHIVGVQSLVVGSQHSAGLSRLQQCKGASGMCYNI